MKSRRVLTAVVIICFFWGNLWAEEKNGFDLSNQLIQSGEIHYGGPPRDGIPSIDRPDFKPASKETLVKDQDRVLGIVRNKIAKAYPINILNYHEIVNDYFGSEPIVVTYCPLCGTGMAFKALIKGERKTFGVSGLLYNSDVLLYDRESKSLWSQIRMQAVTGPLVKTLLTPVVTINTTFGAWKKKYPKTQVLTRNTGYSRYYDSNPYDGYEISEKIWFEVNHLDSRFHNKEWIIGVTLGKKSKAYPMSELVKAGSVVKDRLGNQNLTLKIDKENRTVLVLNDQNKEIPVLQAFWFAWVAFHPKSQVYYFKP